MSYVSIKSVGVHGIALGDWSDALTSRRKTEISASLSKPLSTHQTTTFFAVDLMSFIGH